MAKQNKKHNPAKGPLENGHRHRNGKHAAGHAGSADLTRLNKAFVIGIVPTLIYVAAEFGAGLWLDSLALISDAGHNLSDAISLLLALIAFKLMQVKPSAKYTYGYKKSTVLVSLVNAVILLVAVGIIVWESISKLMNPQPVEGGAIAWIAGIGIIVNAFTAWLFMKDRDRDLNVKGAFLHMAADALVSVGVVISGIIISFTGWFIIDPIIGIVIAAVILISTTRLLLDSLRLSLDGVPASIVPENVKKHIMEREPGIEDIHHIHIWAISTTETALTAHLIIKNREQESAIKGRVKEYLEQLGIQHATLEFEYPGEPCLSTGDCDQE